VNRKLCGPVGVSVATLLLMCLACGSQETESRAGKPDTTTQQMQGESGGQDPDHEETSEARVTLSDTAVRTAGIKVDTVSNNVSVASRTLVVPGQVQFDPRRVALVSSRVPGRIERLMVVQGDKVRDGQTVALLYSPTFITAQTDLVQATRRAKLLAGTADSADAAALADAAARRLRALGLTDSAIAGLAEGGSPNEFLTLTSPLAGTITESHTLSGAALEAGAPVFKVSDLSVIDVVAEVPEQSLPLVEIGLRAEVGIAAYPSMTFKGHVERMSGELNPETRTVQAVVHVPNRAGRLRAGMFATVRLVISGRQDELESARMLSIPASAIVTQGDQNFVFVEVGPNTFERRAVEVASLTPPGSLSPIEGAIAVRRGLAAGERVVVDGAFTLKSELAKASLGEHGH
jgi:RND family efflux transporter MFP subunit